MICATYFIDEDIFKELKNVTGVNRVGKISVCTDGAPYMVGCKVDREGKHQNQLAFVLLHHVIKTNNWNLTVGAVLKQFPLVYKVMVI